MSAARVFVTGLGVVSSLAMDAEQHFARLLKGDSGIDFAPDNVPYAVVCPLDARVRSFDRRRQIRSRMLRKLLTTSAAYAVCAGGEALRDAGLADDVELLARTGLYAGSVCIDFDPEIFIPAMRESLGEDGELDIARFARRGIHLVDPLFLVKTLPNGGVGGIAIEHQVTGPSLNITNGSVSGMQAVISAAAAIRRGETEVALAGAYDSLLSMDSIAEHLIANRLSSGEDGPRAACRPFDVRRSGFVLGEASAFLVLESGVHARRRGVDCYGELTGGGMATGLAGVNRSEPDRASDGLVRAATQALAEAGSDVPEIGAVFGDGLATEEDDLVESRAVERVFADAPPPFTAATASAGHTGAASGALSLVHAAQSLRRQVLPPMINCEQPDPRCALPFVLTPRESRPQPVLVWNSDRGIKNTAVIIAPGVP